MLNCQKNSRIRAKQRGATAVEFGIIAVVFFTLFFGIIEFGRVFYLYNTVQEVTRCAARAAVVTWKGNWGSIPQQCLFGADELVAGWEVHGINVRLRALNLAGNEANPGSVYANLSNCADSPDDANCIRFVEASVWCTGVQNCTNNRITYQPMFGLMIPVSGVGIPNSTVVMPAESLGYY